MQGKKISDRWYAYLLLLPTLLVLTLVIVIPLVEAIGMGFTKTSLISFTKHIPIGWKNYESIFSDPIYWQIVRNTILIVLISVGISLVIGLALALVLNMTTRKKAILRGFYIIPWLIPGVVIGIIWKWILGTETGVINYGLRSLGIIKNNLAWLADTQLSFAVVIMVFVWSSVPYIMVTALAGLQAIPNDLEEAAIMDGARYWQRFWNITLPILIPIMSIAIILRIIYTMQDFAIIFSLTQGGPGNATETFVLYVYKTAFNAARLGKACAIGTTWLLLLLIFVILYFRLIAKRDERLY